MRVTAEQLRRVMPLVKANEADLYAPLLSAAMTEGGIDTPVCAAIFLAQMAHESGQLQRWAENLNYSAQRLMAVWPKRFPTINIAAQYARQPEKLANFVYANRNGNGGPESGDGWKYRGRGPFQITGKDNYITCGESLSLPLTAQPDLLEQPQHGFRSAVWYWNSRQLSPLADAGTAAAFEMITRKINGGLNGLAERRAYWQTAKKVFGLA